MNINTNHVFLAFDRQIDSTKAWLQAKVFSACGYSPEIITDRLMQRLVEMSLQPFTLAVSVLCKSTSNCFPAPGTQMNCSKAFMEIGSGRMTLTPKQWLTNQLNFFLHWAFCLLAIFYVTKSNKNNLPAVLVFGVGEESIFKDGNDEQFVNYCHLGPIEPLRSGKHFLVQSSSNVSSDQPEFEYCRRPLISLLHESNLGLFGRLNLLANHLIIFFAYMSSAVRLPLLTLLGKDFAYSSISVELDKRGLIESIVLTCSSFTSQPLWLRALHRAKVHMIWYAQNWKPIIYASDNLESDVPSLRWIRVDTHWVWTHAFAEYLRTLVHGTSVEAVGPIVWYMPEINSSEKNAMEIIIFDVPPFHDDIALMSGEISNYFHPDNLFSFIEDIISLKSELENYFQLPVSFRLKTKRGYSVSYDRAYFDYLEKLDALGSISRENYSTNMYSLISGSHLVIAYPFTSPAYIAGFLNVPFIYYDPTKSIVRHDFSDDKSLVGFAGCPRDLLNAAISALSNVFPVEAGS